MTGLQEFCVEYKKDDQMDCIMCDAFSPVFQVTETTTENLQYFLNLIKEVMTLFHQNVYCKYI